MCLLYAIRHPHVSLGGRLEFTLAVPALQYLLKGKVREAISLGHI